MKQLSLILAVFLLLSVFLSACGSKDTPGETAASVTSAVTEAKSTEPPEYVKPNVNYNGQKITVATFDLSGMRFKIAQYNMLMEEEIGDIVSDAIVRRNLQVEEELNIEFELMGLTSSDRAKIDTLSKFILAGEDAYDFSLCMEASMKQWLQNPEMLVELNSIPTLDLTHTWWDQKSIKEYTLYGKIYSAPGDLSVLNLGSPITVFFNKEIVKDNNLGDPYELVRSGKWTLDKMIEMCTKAYRDVNGNGQVDIEVDVLGLIDEKLTTLHWYFASGMRITERDSNGDPKLMLNTEKTVNYLEKWVPFFNDAKLTLNADSLSGKYNSTYTDLFIPKMKNNTALFFCNQLLIAMDLRDMDTDFGILPMAKYDEEQAEYIGCCNSYWHEMLLVPVTNSDLDRTGNVIESLGYYGQQLILPAFIDTTILNRDIRDEDSAEMIHLIRDSVTTDVGATFNWGSITNVLYTVVDQKSASVFASTYASKESAIKTALQNTLDALKK